MTVVAVGGTLTVGAAEVEVGSATKGEQDATSVVAKAITAPSVRTLAPDRFILFNCIAPLRPVVLGRLSWLCELCETLAR